MKTYGIYILPKILKKSFKNHCANPVKHFFGVPICPSGRLVVVLIIYHLSGRKIGSKDACPLD